MPNRWFVGILAFFIPPLAFLYISAKKWAVVYLALIVVVGILDFYVDRYFEMSGLGLILSIVAIIHSVKLCKTATEVATKKWFNHWWGVLSIPIALLGFVIFFRSFLFEPFQIPSESMLPTLKVGDHVVVSKFGYGLYGTFGITIYQSDSSDKMPKRGDVFVLYPPHTERVFIERIIGLPGDEVHFSNKQIEINGEQVKTRLIEGSNIVEESVDGNTYRVQYTNDRNQFRDITIAVPAGHYFVMGDNRDNSADSRMWGMVPRSRLVGKMVLIW